jgi:hypothetical protein
MKITGEKFQKYNEIAGIGNMGNFEAKRDGNKLVAAVKSPTVLIRAEMNAEFLEGEEFMMFVSRPTLNAKYLTNFNPKDILTVTSNEDVLSITDNKLTMTMPQLAEEVAKKTSSDAKAPKGIDYNGAIKITFPYDDLAKVLKVAKTLQEMYVAMTVGTDLKFSVKSKATLVSDAEITNAPASPKTMFIKMDTAELAFVGSKDLISFEVPNTEKAAAPVKFSYSAGDSIIVNGYFVPYNPIDEDEPSEKPPKKSACKPKEKGE